MKINKISIWNFRGLNKKIDKLGLQNILTGQNGVGKSNILLVINKIFNIKERRKILLEEDSNLHNKKNIILSAEFEWNHSNDFISENLKIKHILKTPNKGILRYKITLLFIYDLDLDEYDMRTIIGDVPLEKLKDVKDWSDISLSLEKIDYDQKFSTQKLDIDSVFNVVYIAPWNKLKEISEEYMKNYINAKKEETTGITKKLTKFKKDINGQISDIMEGAITDEISNVIKKMNLNKNVTLTSNFKTTSMHKSMKLNLSKTISADEKTTMCEVKGSDGEERLISFLASKTNLHSDLISIVLIEEPENHMHIGLQRKFLDIIFNETGDKSEILFVTTHSPTIVDSVYGQSTIFNLREESDRNTGFRIGKDVEKFIYQTNINKILFSEKIIFVEGHSEEYFLRWFIKNNKEAKNKYLNIEIINVHGVNFIPFINLCINNNIKYQIFTDNDIFGKPPKYQGLKRAYKLAITNMEEKDSVPEIFKKLEEVKWVFSEELSKKIVEQEEQILSFLKERHIYLQSSEYKKTITLENEYLSHGIFTEEEVNAIKSGGKLKKLVELLSKKDENSKIVSSNMDQLTFPLLKALIND